MERLIRGLTPGRIASSLALAAVAGVAKESLRQYKEISKREWIRDLEPKSQGRLDQMLLPVDKMVNTIWVMDVKGLLKSAAENALETVPGLPLKG